jgi:hypothetical protein
VILFTAFTPEIKIYHPDGKMLLRSNEQVFLYDPERFYPEAYDELRKLIFND